MKNLSIIGNGMAACRLLEELVRQKGHELYQITVYGDELGRYEGRVKQGPELDEMATEYAEFQVYVVEVCQSCAWNHLASSYILGTGEPAPRRSRRARAGD